MSDQETRRGRAGGEGAQSKRTRSSVLTWVRNALKSKMVLAGLVTGLLGSIGTVVVGTCTLRAPPHSTVVSPNVTQDPRIDVNPVLNQTVAPTVAQSQAVTFGLDERAVAQLVKSALSEQLGTVKETLQHEIRTGSARVSALIRSASIPAAPASSQLTVPAQDFRAIDLFNAGYRLEDSGKLEEGIASYYTAIHVKPDFALAHGNLGLLLKQKGDIVGAIYHLRQAVEFEPHGRFLRVNLAFALVEHQEFDSAFEQLRTACELPAENDGIQYWLSFENVALNVKDVDEIGRAARTGPPFACAIALLASRYTDRGEFDRAQLLLDAAFREDPANFIASSNQAGLYLAQRSLEAADARFRAMLVGDPNSALARSGLAVVALKREQYEEALELANHALSLNDALSLAQNTQAVALFKLGQTSKAIASLRRGVSLAPSDIEARVNLGLALERHNELQAAIDELKRAVEIEPSNARANYVLGLVLSHAKRLPEARECLSRAAGLSSRGVGLLRSIGVAFAEAGMSSEANRTLRSALELAPTDADTLAALGALLIDGGLYEEGVKLTNAALDINPRQPTAHGALVVERARRGDALGALSRCRNWVSVAPSERSARTKLGYALISADQNDEAMRIFLQLVSEEPKNGEAHVGLGVALLLRTRELGPAMEEWRAAAFLDPRCHQARWYLALGYADLSDSDKALQWLRRAVEMHPDYRQTAVHEKCFEKLRTDPRFLGILAAD